MYSIAYQQHGKYNIIIVDWGALVKVPCYPTAAANTFQAGKCTALLLSNIASLYNGDVSNFHAIGFSLGAHVASFASNSLEKLHKKKLGRITGILTF